MKWRSKLRNDGLNGSVHTFDKTWRLWTITSIAAAAYVALSSFLIVDQSTTFEMVCVRVVVGCFAVVVVVVVYRPGSMSKQHLFFDELATVLNRFATHQVTGKKKFTAIWSFVRLNAMCDSNGISWAIFYELYWYVEMINTTELLLSIDLTMMVE